MIDVTPDEFLEACKILMGPKATRDAVKNLKRYPTDRDWRILLSLMHADDPERLEALARDAADLCGLDPEDVTIEIGPGGDPKISATVH